MPVTKTEFSSQRFKALLFDFDGTLLDSFPVHFDVFKTMFARFGIRIDKQRFLDSYSPNWYKTYEAMGLPQNDWKWADQIWLDEVAHRQPYLFTGVRDALVQLKQRYVLGLVTSGSKSRVERDLDKTGIKPYFKAVVTGDDTRRPKPDPDGLEAALGMLALRPDEAAYVGDANADHEMARSAGVPFIGVRSAYDRFAGDGEFACLNSVTELPGLLGI